MIEVIFLKRAPVNIGLVLAGGVSKGAYQAGFLRALQDENILKNISAVSCSSIGLFGGYALSAGKIDILNEMWQSIHFDSSIDLMMNIWFKHFLRDVIDMLVKEDDVLNVPIYAPVVYLPFIHMEYCKLSGKYIKKWKSFIKGAVSYPVLTGLNFFRGQLTFDGGAMDNIPVFPLLKHENVDVILILHFEAGWRPRRKYLLAGIPVLDYDISISDGIYRKHSFDFYSDTLKSRIETGYRYGKEICGKLFRGGDNDIGEVCAAAEEIKQSELPLRRLSNSTFETWVQRLNEVFYPYVSNADIKVRSLTGTENKYKNKDVKEYVNQEMS